MPRGKTPEGCPVRRAPGARRTRGLSAAGRLLPVRWNPAARGGRPPAEVRAHRADTVRDVVEMDGVDLVRSHYRVRKQGFHGPGARDPQRPRKFQFWLLYAPCLDEP